MEDKDYGYIKIKLADILEEKELSKNKLSHYGDLQRTQINQYCNNNITRLDTAVLARMCYTLGCNIEDLLEYVPPENKK
ncbi:MAG: helix-turn-helix transcriptional regulator [Lachnospiraceae bacterium]|nr:helix-turn-helix transcriptional regulator [Lachnospiraceae bacterium]